MYAVSGNDSSYLTAVCVPKSLALSTFYHSDSNNLYTIGIGKEALKDCRYITKFTVTELIYQIDDSAFENCTALSVLYMNSSVLEEIGANAFRNCSMLKVIELPETLESLGDGTFAGCTSLTAVYAWSYMPAKIGDHLFGEQIPEDLKI